MLVLLVVAWLIGCGGVGHEPSVQRSRNPQQLKELNIKGGRHVKGRSYCVDANAKRGPAPGLVDFSARCLGLAKGGPIDLAISLGSVGEGSRGAKINGYRRRLRVSGAGPGSQSGRCSLRRDAFECSARAMGRAEVAGRFSVSPASECSGEVSVVNITVAACEKHYCEGGLVLNELFRARPKGCPQA